MSFLMTTISGVLRGLAMNLQLARGAREKEHREERNDTYTESKICPEMREASHHLWYTLSGSEPFPSNLDDAYNGHLEILFWSLRAKRDMKPSTKIRNRCDSSGPAIHKLISRRCGHVVDGNDVLELPVIDISSSNRRKVAAKLVWDSQHRSHPEDSKV